ncbi:MAG: type II toxin-antitoxin system RelE/ParE family toxin [Nitrosomonadales bacterium]|nr:type II toxin-antitoxin system RelE/ParE family toxin [Nitrosomonadales bacterium]
MARYVVSPLAEQDIEAIGDYIEQDNPHRALTFIAQLRSQCDKITFSPKACRLRPELGENIRSFAYGNYVIFFQDGLTGICIVRVLHGAMDIEAKFSEGQQ